MADHASDSLLIPASRDDVLAVILDLEAYPDWTGNIRRVDVTERDVEGRPVLARFVVDARVLEIAYTLRYHHAGAHLQWTLEDGEGVVRQLDGEYRIEEQDDGVLVTYSLDVDATMPLPAYLRNRAARVVLDMSLNGLRDRVAATV